MATAPEKIDLQKFLTDPSFQHDREFLEGFVTQLLEKKAKEVEDKRLQENANQPQNIFDRLFGRNR